jgi:hypothetical protein
MRVVKTYASRIEADLDRVTLEAADVPALVVGVGMALEGGIEGVKLLVPDDMAERALQILAQR